MQARFLTVRKRACCINIRLCGILNIKQNVTARDREYIFVHRRVCPVKQKCSAKMRAGGKWLLKQLRSGARMCQGTFF